MSVEASVPSTFTAFTVSFKAPRETYPIALLSPATLLITTSVLFAMIALVAVLSVLLPSASFSSTPVSSTNAPLVPEPFSRLTTEIVPLTAPLSDDFAALPLLPEALPHPAKSPNIITLPNTTVATFLTCSFLIFKISFRLKQL